MSTRIDGHLTINGRGMETISSAFVVIAILLLSFVQFSCTPVGSSIRHERNANTLVSDSPPFSILLKKDIVGVFGSGKIRTLQFVEGEPLSIIVQIDKWIENNIDYYYSLSHIASEIGFYYIESAHFDEKEWAKVAYFDKKNLLYCGYFTRKDNSLIVVMSEKNITDKDIIESLKKHKNAEKITQIGLDVINKQFDELHNAIEIQY